MCQLCQRTRVPARLCGIHRHLDVLPTLPQLGHSLVGMDRVQAYSVCLAIPLMTRFVNPPLMSREKERSAFLPLQDRWAAPWLRYMIFLPIALLQLLNLFWYFLILRIMFR